MSREAGGKHHVFLSFRGKDVRRRIISHLYEALQQRKIPTFKDDDELAKGDEISQALFDAIEEAKVSVVTFSEDYASSTWCLDELVKIIDCKNTKGQIVIPVFYGVTPSDVRHQTGSFAYAFANHERHHFEDQKILQRWRYALKEVSHLSGWNLSHAKDEAELVKNIVKDISKKLNHKSLSDVRGQINLENAPSVVGRLLDDGYPEDFIQYFILSAGSFLPLEPLVDECEKRNRLCVLTQFLEHLVSEGSQDIYVHTALAKIIIDSNSKPERFLATNPYYDFRVIGKYCEKRDPTLAAIAYSRGQCEDEFINITNRNSLFELQARCVVERMDSDLWGIVLSRDNIAYRRQLIDQVVSTVLPESRSAEQVSVAVKAFLAADLPYELMELLEKLLLQHSMFSGNFNLQNLLILSAIKTDRSRVMHYIDSLDNFEGHSIGEIAVEAQMYEEAFAAFKKCNLNVQAVNVLLDKIQSIDRAVEFAICVKEDSVWSRVAKAQHQTKFLDVS